MHFFVYDDEGVSWYASQRPDTEPVANAVPLYQIRNPARTGTKWHGPSGSTALIDSTDETVTVPAGTFKKCLKVTVSGSFESGPPVAPQFVKSYVLYYWYAPGVGQIKVVERHVQLDGVVRELEMQLEDYRE
jgi:hypothetical protein